MFKIVVVDLGLSGKASKDVAEDPGINSNLLHRWRREYSEFGDNSFAGNGKQVMTASEVEIATLFRKDLMQNKVIQSMSRKGNCLDNAVAENFFKKLKSELVQH